MRIRRSYAALAAAAAMGLTLAACNDSPTEPTSQTPALDPVVVTAAATLGTGTIASRHATGKCIDASHGSATLSAPTLLEPCGTAAGQQFTWQSNGSVSTFGGAMCLTDKGAKGLTYDPIIIYPCQQLDGATLDPQQRRRNCRHKRQVLERTPRGHYQRLGLILYPCANGPSQAWTANGTSQTPRRPLSIAVSSGNNQVATYGAAVAKPLVVIVHKAAGALAPGVTVTWKATDGTVSAASAVTNAAGLAQVTFKTSPTFFISKATGTVGGSVRHVHGDRQRHARPAKPQDLSGVKPVEHRHLHRGHRSQLRPP